ncbi:MAG: Rieske (2Fe-2S) protein [Nitrososphaerales archaeon]
MLVKLCKVSEISEDSPSRFDINGIPIMITKLGNNFFASGALCTHEEADLTLGMLSGEVITCPLHQAKFDLRTGQVLEGPNGTESSTIRSLNGYRVQIVGEELWIDL